ncbi:MAG: hypothetical protein A2008_04740 [Candidatus Wallbacteria bacterium GWC2_49_35]|uniref:Uncharacterized protein n=1 Tax=Candidatus Wallbacteria bacterium GWC2_49_35 TaxID=1817813 RepID=A0A1F7WNC3_9BACT|nr:MAG: hypothetical protein A2008_04740 [Candidatus Wallbacteria bacterium GWC2_49_35]
MRKRLIFSASNEQIKAVPQTIGEPAALEISAAVPSSGAECGIETHNHNSKSNITSMNIKRGI